MDTFTLVKRALAASADDPDKADLDAREIEVGRITAAVQTVVDALTPPDGGRYVVGFSNIATAQTSLGERRITVSAKPLHDRSLSLVEKAVVIATFAAHEIGHTLVTAPRKALVPVHNSHSGYHAVANLADDIILEPYMVDRFPILRDAFDFTGMWVLRSTCDVLPRRVFMKSGMTTPERFNVILSATRYGNVDEVVWADNALDERTWGRAWADRLLAARLNDHTTFLALCDEAWERIRTEAVVEPDDDSGCGLPGPSNDDSEPTDEDGEGDGPPTQSEDGEEPDANEAPRDWGDDEGEPESESENGSEDGESEDDDEDGDEGNGGDEDSDDESDDTTDGATDDESDADSDDDENDGESDEDATDNGPAEDHPDSESEPGKDDAPPGGGGNSEAPLRPEDEWDEDEVDQTTHDSIEPPDYNPVGEDAEELVRTFNSSTVTSFGKHGSLRTTWF